MSRSEPPSDFIALEPNAILGLGGNRWLTSEGRILAAELGDTVELQPATLELWEAAALYGTGKPLIDLFAGLSHTTDRRVRELEMLEDLQFDAAAVYAANPSNEHAGRVLKRLKERIDGSKTDLLIDLGRGGLDPID